MIKKGNCFEIFLLINLLADNKPNIGSISQQYLKYSTSGNISGYCFERLPIFVVYSEVEKATGTVSVHFILMSMLTAYLTHMQL